MEPSGQTRGGGTLDVRKREQEVIQTGNVKEGKHRRRRRRDKQGRENTTEVKMGGRGVQRWELSSRRR